MREADFDRADSLDMKLEPEQRTLRAHHVGRTIVAGDSAAVAKAVAALREAPNEALPAARIAARYARVDVSQQIVELLAQLPEQERRARRFAPYLSMARGRSNDASRQLSELAASEAELARSLRTTAAHLPFVPMTPEDLRALYAELEEHPAAPPPNTPFSALRNELQLHSLAVISCRLGDHARALELARRIEADAPASEWRPLTANLAAEIRMQVAARTGKPEEALRILDSLDPTPMLELYGSVLGGVFLPYWRAELRYQLGHDEAALKWLENGFVHASYEMLGHGYRHLRMAEIHDRQGNAKRAAEHYAKVLAYWGDADPPLQAEVQRARTRLAALTGEGRR